MAVEKVRSMCERRIKEWRDDRKRLTGLGLIGFFVGLFVEGLLVDGFCADGIFVGDIVVVGFDVLRLREVGFLVVGLVVA